jgi:dUTP pyrophosphatase
MNKVQVQIMRLPHAVDLPLPSVHTTGLDLAAAIPPDMPIFIWPEERAAIPTGLAIALLPGFEGQIRPRTGLALRHGITVLNSPGTVSADYRGEIQVVLINHGKRPFTVERGARIAQLVLSPTMQAALREVVILDEDKTEEAAL